MASLVFSGNMEHTPRWEITVGTFYLNIFVIQRIINRKKYSYIGEVSLELYSLYLPSGKLLNLEINKTRSYLMNKNENFNIDNVLCKQLEQSNKIINVIFIFYHHVPLLK